MADRYSVFNAMVDIVVAPSRALGEVKVHPRWFWWPLSVMLGLTCLAFVHYLNWVDFEWLVNDAIRTAIAGGMDPDEAEMLRDFMSPRFQLWSSVIAIIVVTFVIYSIQATYLHLVNKSAGDPSLGWSRWFSFTAWTSFVGVFNAAAMFIVILMTDGNQLAQHELSPLSMNALFLHAQPGDPWFTWGNSLTLINFWMLYLMTLGFARWTGSSMGKSAIVAVTPWALIFGGWAALIAF